MEAFAEGDGQAACDRLTASAQHNLATGSGASSCEDGVAKLARSLDDSARDKLKNVRVSEANIIGAKATVKLASGQTQPPAAVPLEKADGEWRLAGFPSGVNFGSQAEAECISGGMQGFDAGSVAPFWRKEGRSDFRDYIVAICRRADQRGVLESQDKAALEKIARSVLLEMDKRHQIRLPDR